MLGEWAELPEDPDDPDEWAIEEGSLMPCWAWNAMIRRDIILEPEPELGELDWARDIKVTATGKVFPMGSIIRRSDIPQPAPS